MAISVFELFKIGIGPSSSHTVGPMRAALLFATGLKEHGLLAQTESIKAELYGSLGATGKGHGSDKAVLLGLQGEAPDLIDTETVADKLAQIRGGKRLNLLGEKEIPFNESEQFLFYKRQSLPVHTKHDDAALSVQKRRRVAAAMRRTQVLRQPTDAGKRKGMAA
jgi:L-serine dehydratase